MKRPLQPEEKELWARVVRDVARAPGTPAPDVGGPAEARAPTKKSELARSAAPSSLIDRCKKPSRQTIRDVFESGEPGLEKRLMRGRLKIDGRIDLHGLTEAEAQYQLYEFISVSHERGRRAVLVITGKGRREDPREAFEHHPRGIIRRRFFDWVNAAHFRTHIARVAPAHLKDGGAGAFYVFLKSSASRMTELSR